MELEVTTIHDFVIDISEDNEDADFDQFTLVEIFGVYLIIHTYEDKTRMRQELIAYDNMEEAGKYLELKGIEASKFEGVS